MSAPQVINRAVTTLFCIGSALCIVFTAQVMWWAADRDAPFVMLGYSAQPVKARQATVIRAMVRRDLSRRCSVLFSRTFYDSKGTRFELTDGAQLMNSTALEAYNKRSPDVLSFAVYVPAAAAPGVGSVMTALDYECNPIHQFYPISMALNMNIEVLP